MGDGEVEMDKMRQRCWGETLVLLIPVLVFMGFRWTIDRNNFFLMDDWGWLSKSVFEDYTNIFSILPVKPYNDRPVGAIFIKFVYEVVGLNYRAFHFVHLAVHILNAMLVYFILRALKYGERLAVVGALLFGMSYAAFKAVTWVAAVFDLLGCTLLLLMLYDYVRNGKTTVSGVAWYYLAIRTKEFCLLLPFILLVYEYARHQHGGLRNFIAEAARKQYGYWIVFLVLACAYAYRLHSSVYVASPDHIYYLNVGLDSFLGGLRYYYLAQLQNDPKMIAGVSAFLLLGTAIAAWDFKRTGDTSGAKLLLFCATSFYLVLLPVLFLAHHRDPLYLYAASPFVAIAVTEVLSRLGALTRIDRFAELEKLLFLAGVIFACSLSAMPFAKDRTNFTLLYGKKNRANYEFLTTAVKSLPASVIVYVANVPSELDNFRFGSGCVLFAAYGRQDLSVRFASVPDGNMQEYQQLPSPKVFVHYAGDVMDKAVLE